MAPTVQPMCGVCGVAQREHGDGLGPLIDDPVLRDRRFGVVVVFLDEIPLGPIRTYYLNDDIRAGPEAIAAARVSRIADQQQVRLAKLARSNAQAKRREQRFAARRLTKRAECQLKKGENSPMPA